MTVGTTIKRLALLTTLSLGVVSATAPVATLIQGTHVLAATISSDTGDTAYPGGEAPYYVGGQPNGGSDGQYLAMCTNGTHLTSAQRLTCQDIGY